ncbi:hypothetical protein D3C78_1075810 [compost metagenome]
MGRSRAADRGFEHRAAVPADVGGLGHGRDLARAQQAAMLGHLEREHMRGLLARQHHRVLRRAHGLIRHDQRALELLRQLAQRGHVPLGHGLLDQRDAGFDQLGQVAPGRIAVPGLVHVHRERGRIGQAARDAAHMGHIVLRRARTDLHLEDAVAALLQAQLGFLQVALHVAAGQGPGQGQAFVQLAAQQLPGGNIQGAGQGVDQRHFHGRLGKGIAFAGHVHARQQVLDAAGFLAQHGRRQIVRDRVGDALGRLFVPRGAADGRRLAETAGAVAQPQLHDDRALALDGAKRQLVRTNSGNVQNARFDALDGEFVAHAVSLLRRAGRKIAAWRQLNVGFSTNPMIYFINYVR